MQGRIICGPVSYIEKVFTHVVGHCVSLVRQSEDFSLKRGGGEYGSHTLYYKSVQCQRGEPGGKSITMRKSITLFLILAAISAGGREITPSEASSVASEFFGAVNGVGRKSPVSRVLTDGGSMSVSQPYYVFNADDNRGFVIVSGDDRAQKILGYSDKGSFDFDNVPPQLAGMLAGYSERLKSVSAGAEPHPSWSTATVSGATGGEVVLETAEWGQGAPYNAFCPVIGEEHAPTGCVATAMAIVMKYHGWPESYNWTAMPSGDVDADNSSEIALLMKDAGASVLMHYSPEESTANMNFVGHRLRQNFRYGPECQYITARNFAQDMWVSLLKSNIDNGNPVIYNGSGTGNHAFVIDGYNENELYHINWGWNGLFNGMYALNALTPDSSDFSGDAGMVINIAPDMSGREYSKVFCDYGYFWATAGMAVGSHFSTDAPAQNMKFDYTCNVISYPCDDSGEIGLLLYDGESNVKEVLKTQVFVESQDDSGMGISGAFVQFYDIVIASEVMSDDYVALATRKTLSDAWLEVTGTIEAPVKRTIADIKEDVGIVKVINNTRANKIIVNIPGRDTWRDLEPDENIIERVIGSDFHIKVVDGSGQDCETVTIKVEGTGLYANTSVSHNGNALFPVYGEMYTITIDEAESGMEKILMLDEAGTLATALSGVRLDYIESLTISGFINAEDLWFIRDNIKSLNVLDISEARIMACEASDPVDAFQISGSKHAEDVLPAYALAGLGRLGTLKLPRELKDIGSNSMMGLAISRIEIPATVRTIGLNVFFDCENLKTVVNRVAVPIVVNDCIFTNTPCPGSGVLYVPVGSQDAYEKAPVWQDFAQIIEDDNPLPDSDVITYEGLQYRIHGKALYLTGYVGEQLAADVLIPDAVTADGHEFIVLGIDDNAMQNAKINSFTMPNTVTSIGSYIFTGSTVASVRMSDNIKSLPYCCVDGTYIEEIHLPENAESLCNSIYCPSLKKLHLPKKLKSEAGCMGSIGGGFQSLEEITVDPENEEWSVCDGILYWSGLSHLIRIPNNMSGEIVIPDETTDICQIEYCNDITKITFGKGIKALGYGSVSNCLNLKHIEFNDNIIFTSNSVLLNLPALESFAIGDFVWSYGECFGMLPALKYVYVLNDNHVDFGNSFYSSVSEKHDYFTSSLNPQMTVPSGCKIYVAGGLVDGGRYSEDMYEEMWSYQINRKSGKIKIEPLIDGLSIDRVAINDNTFEGSTGGIYKFAGDAESHFSVTVEFTLHGRQKMTTYYDERFNASVPDTDLTSVLPTVADGDNQRTDVYNLQGICVCRGATQADIDGLPSGVYIIQGRKILVGK